MPRKSKKEEAAKDQEVKEEPKKKAAKSKASSTKTKTKSEEPSKRGNWLLPLIVIVAIVAIVIIYIIASKNQPAPANIPDDKTVEELQKRVEDLEKQLPEIKETTNDINKDVDQIKEEAEQEKLANPDWVSYKNDQLGIEFQYPENWGTPQINTFQYQENDFANVLDQETIDQVAKTSTNISFKGPFSASNTWSNIVIQILNYTDKTPIEALCYEGSCDTINLIDQKAEIAANPNVQISGLNGLLKDYYFVPGASVQRDYTVILPTARIKISAGYRTDLSNDDPMAEWGKILQDNGSWDDIINNNPTDAEVATFKQFADTLTNFVNTIKLQ